MPKPTKPPLAIPRQPVPQGTKNVIAKVANKRDAAVIVDEMARESLTPARWNQNVRSEHLELILVRVAAGATLRSVCLELGIASAQVLQRAIDDHEFSKRYAQAKEWQGFSLFDMMVDVAWSDEESVERSKLKVSVLDRMARTFNRSLSDRQQIDIRTQSTYVLPPDADDF